jgi:hypothetical protein
MDRPYIIKGKVEEDFSSITLTVSWIGFLDRYRRETLEILSRPDWVEAINQGLRASEKGETIKWRRKKAGK